jgi:hypothetical protein
MTVVSSSLLWNSDLQICKRGAGSYLSKKIVSGFEETNQELHGETDISSQRTEPTQKTREGNLEEKLTWRLIDQWKTSV